MGEDLHWVRGLDLFAAYGLEVVFVPHWDNAEGGAQLDTSHCYVGAERFARLRALLPATATVVGIDEHTALVVEVAAQVCRVLGRGGLTVECEGQAAHFRSGETFPIAQLGNFHAAPSADLPGEVWRAALAAAAEDVPRPPEPPRAVLALVAKRQAARANRDWSTADSLRREIASLGWHVSDTPTGPTLSPLSVPGA